MFFQRLTKILAAFAVIAVAFHALVLNDRPRHIVTRQVEIPDEPSVTTSSSTLVALSLSTSTSTLRLKLLTIADSSSYSSSTTDKRPSFPDYIASSTSSTGNLTSSTNTVRPFFSVSSTIVGPSTTSAPSTSSISDTGDTEDSGTDWGYGTDDENEDEDEDDDEDMDYADDAMDFAEESDDSDNRLPSVPLTSTEFHIPADLFDQDPDQPDRAPLWPFYGRRMEDSRVSPAFHQPTSSCGNHHREGVADAPLRSDCIAALRRYTPGPFVPERGHHYQQTVGTCQLDFVAYVAHIPVTIQTYDIFQGFLAIFLACPAERGLYISNYAYHSVAQLGVLQVYRYPEPSPIPSDEDDPGAEGGGTDTSDIGQDSGPDISNMGEDSDG